MSWNTPGKVFQNQRSIPQPHPSRNGSYLTKLHSIHQTGFQSEDLSVTATAMSTTGSFHEPTLPRERKLKLSSSDSSAIGIIRQQSDIVIKQQRDTGTGRHRRVRTMNDIGLIDKQLPLPPIQTKKQQVGVGGAGIQPLPPIQQSFTKRSESGIDQMSEPNTMDATPDTGSCSIYDKDETSNTSDEEDDEIISDDDGDSSSEELPQSSLKFHDPSRSSFSSLAEVDLPKPVTDSQPFVTTLLQEQLVNEHEVIMKGVNPLGMSARVNNIVRAFELKGPLDKKLLETALHNVVKLHPIVSSSFHKHNGKLYCLVPQDSSAINLEKPLSYEKPQELITLARRKAFEISIITHENSNTDTLPAYIDFEDHMSVVSCGKEDSPKPIMKSITNTDRHPKLSSKLPSIDNTSFPPLIRAKLISINSEINSNDHVLILSFSRVICDYWSSCLFVQQLSHAYRQLESSKFHRPSLASMRASTKRQEALEHAERIRSNAGFKRHKIGATSEIRTHRTRTAGQGAVPSSGFQPICPPKAHFQQIAMRENQILLIRPKERLWNFWQSVITVKIKGTRGVPRIKVIPPVRIPEGFSKITRTTGLARPKTGRFRPLTAQKRPQTARKGSGFGMDTSTLESLNGPERNTEFIKIHEEIGSSFIQSLPIEYSSKIESKELLSLMCFGAYVLMLGVCSKGWGLSELLSRCVVKEDEETNLDSPAPDPLLKYSKNDEEQLNRIMTGGRSQTARRRSDTRKKMDVGSFLIGVNVSVRQLAPELTCGLFGPLTNVIGLRVDLSSSPTFADLIQSLWLNLQTSRCHSHYSFSDVASELGLVQGLPVQFSYLYPSDVQQLSNPDGFHFMETSVGVTGKALAQFGSSCYMNPLSTKMDDNVQLELLMWENVRGAAVDGIFLYHSQSLRSDIVKAFSDEMLRLLSYVSDNPTIPLRELAAIIKPPYLHTASRSKR